MYLHLGSDYMIKTSEIIAIFNLRSRESSIYENYILKEKQRYTLIDLADKAENRSSCILTTKKIYLSPISSLTLKKRLIEGL